MCSSLARASKACPGTCRGGSCGGQPRVWIVAASDGMVCLLEKRSDGVIAPVSDTSGELLFPSVEAFQNALKRADDAMLLQQLILVGSAGDIAWTHRCMPDAVSRHITAEIEYPLVGGWFREPHMASLTRAVGQLLT